MSEYRLNERSETELYEIFLEGLEYFGFRQAKRYSEELSRTFQLLADNPRMGRPAEDIGSGVRRHEHGSHIILYREEPDGVTVLAVVPSRSARRLRL